MQIIRTKDEKEKKKQKVKTQPLIGQQTLMVWDESKDLFSICLEIISLKTRPNQDKNWSVSWLHCNCARWERRPSLDGRCTVERSACRWRRDRFLFFFFFFQRREPCAGILLPRTEAAFNSGGCVTHWEPYSPTVDVGYVTCRARGVPCALLLAPCRRRSLTGSDSRFPTTWKQKTTKPQCQFTVRSRIGRTGSLLAWIAETTEQCLVKIVKLWNSHERQVKDSFGNDPRPSGRYH